MSALALIGQAVGAGALGVLCGYPAGRRHGCLRERARCYRRIAAMKEIQRAILNSTARSSRLPASGYGWTDREAVDA